ncbi:uncharacterized protein LOC143357631 [Halictus rubicundus]|uniref:uncharacterized protein LOC143357631 n=1 Tax=Halictus rubicundus TaxID=77578 RepID=UPI0040365F5A
MSTEYKDVSISLANFLMKLSGCWLATTDGEHRRRMIATTYTFIILSFGVYIDINDICHSMGDISNILYMSTNLFMTVIALIKAILMHLNKERFLKLVLYTRRNFWHSNYDDNEKVFVDEARRYFTFIIVVAYCVTVYIPFTYVVIPIYENIGRNHSDRALPLRMWTDLPIYETPYFEICFVLQALCVFQIGICYVCLDSYLLLVNTHTACQFRILQDKLLNLLDPNSEMIDSPYCADHCHQGLRRYIRKHQALINYCDRLEIVFSFNIFSYVLIFSVVTCLSMYQVLLGEISTTRRLSFLVYIGGSVFQLMVLTSSCGTLITESTNVGEVAYTISWAALSMNQSGRSVRRDVQMIITRSQKPCQLTAGGFFPVSLQTSTKLISSAVSYFTLLRESSSNLEAVSVFDQYYSWKKMFTSAQVTSTWVITSTRSPFIKVIINICIGRFLRQNNESRINDFNITSYSEYNNKSVQHVLLPLFLRHHTAVDDEDHAEMSMQYNDISILISDFFMKVTGCWLTKTEGERRRRMIARDYAFIILLFGIYIDIIDIYHSLGDISVLDNKVSKCSFLRRRFAKVTNHTFHRLFDSGFGLIFFQLQNILYTTANLFITTMALLKTILMHLNKERFLNLVLYSKRNFWHSNYDDNEKVFVDEARRSYAFIMTVTYCIMVYVPGSYIVIPIIENRGRNHSERVLPFRMWSDLPLYETPYFEICFVLQALCTIHVGICYVCLDNFLLLVNTHTACQFRILQNNLRNLLVPKSEMIDSPHYADKCYQDLRRCVRKHQVLINYCDRLEINFSFNIFCYVLVFSVLTCLSMYQALLGEISAKQRLSFAIYLGGSVFQLLMITNSCGSLITESTNVGEVAYTISWAALSMNKSGRTVRRDVQMIITRSQKPCQLTAGGFFPVSLQTSTKLISSAVSYFTLLRESSTNLEDTHEHYVPTDTHRTMKITQVASPWADQSHLKMSTDYKDISISLADFLMKLSGCWLATTDREQRERMIARNYTFIILSFGIYLDINDICHSMGDISNILYMFTNLFITATALMKAILMHLNKERFLNLVLYTRRNFWHSNYDDNEKVFVDEARKYFTFVIVVAYCIMVYVPCSYVVIPIYENIGRNHSDRALPFRMWSDLPLYETPYFEICFVLQALCVFHIGICYVCLDSFMFLVNTHTVCQFRMLQDKLLNLLDPNSEMIDSPDYADQCYQGLRRYIRKHQALINYCDRLEIVFSFNIFSYVLVFSVGTCLSMYQVLLGEISTIRRLSFLIYIGGSVFQLMMITSSCGSLTTESTNVGVVAYAISWAALSMNKSGRTVRRDVQMIITRSQKPCQLTAGGFFPVSLQTSTKLISSAVSYFTLLRESSSNLEDTKLPEHV